MGEIDSGVVAWVLAATLLVQVMTPALAFFYGGFVSSQSIIHTMMYSFAVMGVVSVLWALVGYSLAFGPSALGGWIGDASLSALPISDNVRAGTLVPELLFMVYEMMFAVITPAVISGAIVEKLKLGWFVAFSALWTILVYCPLAHWVWASDGWLFQRGLLDFAGGTVVETASGVSAFVLAWCIGRPIPSTPVRPHNVPYILLGASLLWFGWFGFNAGSAVDASTDAAQTSSIAARAFVNTHLAAAMAMVTWLALEVVAPEASPLFSGKPSAVGASVGAVCGLVAITPACGYVLPMLSIFIGFITTLVVYFAARLIKRSGVDDRLEVFAFHGMSGIVGTFLTGLFATTKAGAPRDGAFYGSGGSHQLGVQCLGIIVTIAYTGGGTAIIYGVLHLIARALGLDMLIARDDNNIDASQHGERAYYDALATPKARSDSSVRSHSPAGDGDESDGSSRGSFDAVEKPAAYAASIAARHPTMAKSAGARGLLQ